MQPLEVIYPIPMLQANQKNVGGMPSVLISRETAKGKLAKHLKTRMDECLTLGSCGAQQLYQDITGNLGSPRATNVSINADFREAFLHHISPDTNSHQLKALYSLGNHSYFSESAYAMDDYKVRYWGSNYDKLLQIKQKYDSGNVFQCYNCVGFDFTKAEGSNKLMIIILAVVGSLLVVAVTVFVVQNKCTKRRREILSKELLSAE